MKRTLFSDKHSERTENTDGLPQNNTDGLPQNNTNGLPQNNTDGLPHNCYGRPSGQGGAMVDAPLTFCKHLKEELLA